MPSPRLRPRLIVAAAAALAALSPAAASAQSLLDLYDAAHAYDATYLSARALYESAPYRVEQSRALMRPSATLAGNASRSEFNPNRGPYFGGSANSASISGRQPIFNQLNRATIAQSERSLGSSAACDT